MSSVAAQPGELDQPPFATHQLTMSEGTNPTTVVHDIHQRQRAHGPAAILGVGTAYPAANCVRQEEFADWYFRVTKSDHLTELKTKMKKICEKSGIKKRHFHHTEEFIAAHSELLDLSLPSLTTRLGIAADAGTALAAAAASKAIADWGRPAADVTHLVVSANSAGMEPGADLRLAGLIGLRAGVRRTLLCLHGCSAGLVALRVAKDIAENNRGARVLVACAQAKAMLFGPPGGVPLDLVVAMSLFADGAGAAILGADPEEEDGPAERPIFHLVSASQATVPGTDRAVVMSLSETGIVNTQSRLSVEVPRLVRGAIERCLADALEPLGLPVASSGGGGGQNWNGLFWAVHPGGRAILDTYEAALGLQPGKLAASRHVLSEYGNMMGATVIFVLDEIRRRRRHRDGAEHEEDCEWGVMTGLGPGLTIETIVLHAAGSWGEI